MNVFKYILTINICKYIYKMQFCVEFDRTMILKKHMLMRTIEKLTDLILSFNY